MLFGMSLLTLAHASVFCPGGSCNGIDYGVNYAANDIGLSTNSPLATINSIIDTAKFYVNILAIAVIVIAGFSLILGLGSENSKETARKIVLYTAVGIIIIALANVIVDFFQSINDPTLSIDLRQNILDIILFVINFAALLAVAAIVIAGIMLILSFGEEGRKDTAKKTIIYAIVGLIVIVLASAIVRFVAEIFT